MLNQILQSSKDPQKLSMTVTGLLSGLIPVIGAVMVLTGHQIDDTAMQSIVAAIGTTIIAVGSVVSGVQIVWGLIRKFIPKSTPTV